MLDLREILDYQVYYSLSLYQFIILDSYQVPMEMLDLREILVQVLASK